MAQPSVGLVLADTESYTLANNALQHCVTAFAFDQVTVFTDRPEYWPQYRTVQIPKITGIGDYNRLILEDLARLIDTDFVLIAQFDGFILNGDRFTPDFYEYDYIGAVWPGYPEHRVGNGGFSWRSRRLIQAAASLAAERPEDEAEDLFICRRLRPRLEREQGCRFADEATANRFSHEIAPCADPTFGFHGIFHLPAIYQSNPEFLVQHLPERTLRQQLGFIEYGVQQLEPEVQQRYRALLGARLAALGLSGPARPAVAPEAPAAAPAEPSADLFEHLLAMGHRRSPHWVAYETKAPVAADAPTPAQAGKRLIAYYLPQFHAVEVNDRNWGKGFTEWRNVARALPLFPGHYQPRHPADLGFYDLNNTETLAQQAALARNYGLSGWAFYHYWFDGQKLLDMPIERLHRNPQIDMPFCVFWANENWTRSWDGQQQNVLLAQAHSPADDLAFIASVGRYFEDRRYIRHQGRPVLMMYRPQLLPDARATTDRWRTWCVQQGLGNPYLIATEAYGLTRPSDYGFDAAAEFPPHRGSACEAQALRAHPIGQRFGPQRDIVAIDYASAVRAWSRQPPPGSEKLFKCVFPMWDNASRRVDSVPTIFQNATPALYEAWLRYCLNQAEPDDFVFVNAWNEWAEGAYLEPDLHFGHAFLEATWRALHG